MATMLSPYKAAHIIDMRQCINKCCATHRSVQRKEKGDNRRYRRIRSGLSRDDSCACICSDKRCLNDSIDTICIDLNDRKHDRKYPRVRPILVLTDVNKTNLCSTLNQ